MKNSQEKQNRINIMVHGGNNREIGINKLPNNADTVSYYNDIKNDFEGLKKLYPFSQLSILPTVDAYEAMINCVAVGQDIITATNGIKTDFINEFSKELFIIIPYDYKEKGCEVYGGKWISVDRIPQKDRHYFTRLQDGTCKMCVGVPDSFSHMKNVILECVRTADNMLVAYEIFQKGVSKDVNLIAYSHGIEGKKEYERNKKRYFRR